MSLKLLNLVFKCGSILALTLTPIRIEETRVIFPSSIYAFLWIILFTTGVSISGIYRKTPYKSMSPIRLIVQTSTDILLFTLNISTIAILIKKKREWFKLINFLETTKDDEDSKNACWFLPFLTANAVFVFLHSYETIIWTKTMGIEFYQLYAVEYFQMYAQFIVYFVIYVILNMLLQRYQNVCKFLADQLNVQYQQNYVFILKKTKNNIYILGECVNVFNEIFGWLILQLIGFTTLQLLAHFQSIIIGAKRAPQTLVYNVTFILWHLVSY